MTGTPPAALALVRAALTDARRITGPHTAEDDAQHVIDELTAAGWHITPDTTDQPA